MSLLPKSPSDGLSGSESPALPQALGSSLGQIIRMQTVAVSEGSQTPPSNRFSTLSSYHSIATICADVIPGWKAAIGEEPSMGKLEIKQLLEGLSNQLFKVTLRDVPSSSVAFSTVLFRIYGEHVSSFYDPDHELLVFQTLSTLNIGPKMIANGPGWRIEEFHDSVVVPVSSLPNPSIFCQVASQLGRLHKIHTNPKFPSSFPHEPVTLKRLSKWTSEGLAALTRLPHPEAIRANLRIDEVLAQLEKMEAIVSARGPEGWDVVFCHNDVQENNILLTAYGLRLIDFEYADFNFQLADIGNFFNEFTMDYLWDGPGGFKASPEAYPSLAARRMFAAVYLSEYLGHPVMEDGGAMSEQISNLVDAAEIGSLLSHLLWGMWSLVRAQQFADTFGAFDFVNYAKFRFDCFLDKIATVD